MRRSQKLYKQDIKKKIYYLCNNPGEVRVRFVVDKFAL